MYPVLAKVVPGLPGMVRLTARALIAAYRFLERIEPTVGPLLLTLAGEAPPTTGAKG